MLVPNTAPTPTQEHGVLAMLKAPLYLLTLLLHSAVTYLLSAVECCPAFFRHHPPGRTDKKLCRCFGAPACRVSPDHLITVSFLASALSLPCTRSCDTRSPQEMFTESATASNPEAPSSLTQHDALCRCLVLCRLGLVQRRHAVAHVAVEGRPLVCR